MSFIKEIMNKSVKGAVILESSDAGHVLSVKIVSQLQSDDEIDGHITREYRPNPDNPQTAILKKYKSDHEGKPFDKEFKSKEVGLDEMNRYIEAANEVVKDNKSGYPSKSQKKVVKKTLQLPDNGVPNSFVKLDIKPLDIIESFKNKYGEDITKALVLEHSSKNSIREGHIVHTHLILKDVEAELYNSNRGRDGNQR